MYKSRLKRWNCRKYKTDDPGIDRRRPHVIDGVARPKHVTSPRKFARSEHLLHCLDAYFSGAFENATWNIPGQGDLVRSSSRSFGLFTAHDLFKAVSIALNVPSKDDPSRAGQAWSRVSDAITSIVKREDIETSVWLCYLTKKLLSQGKLEIAQTILRQCSELTLTIKRSANHPLHIISSHLLEVKHSEMDQLMIRLQSKIVATLETKLGDSHLETLAHRGVLVRLLPEESDRRFETKRLLHKYRHHDLSQNLPFWFLWFEYRRLGFLHEGVVPEDLREFQTLFSRPEIQNRPLPSVFPASLLALQSDICFNKLNQCQRQVTKPLADRILKLARGPMHYCAPMIYSTLECLEADVRAMGNLETASSISALRGQVRQSLQ